MGSISIGIFPFVFPLPHGHCIFACVVRTVTVTNIDIMLPILSRLVTMGGEVPDRSSRYPVVQITCRHQSISVHFTRLNNY